MTTTRILNARVLTMCRRADDALGVIPSAEVVIRDGVIASVSPTAPRSAAAEVTTTIDAAGRVLMPGFVDAHTHALWAGDRLDEWEMKRRGVPYLEILKSGGGIMSTVRAVRQATPETLESHLLNRLNVMAREGTTTVEVKSGYGLSTDGELKMLRAIRAAAARFEGRVVPTALLGHALDPDLPAERFINTVIEETLPAVHDEFPSITIDAFCEQGAWPLESCIRLFERAIAMGHPFRVHTDQFNSLGMSEWAISHGARSVDHLEATSDSTLAAIGASSSYAVMLPCTGFHTDGRYANGAKLIAAGMADRIVIASNINPGSAPCSSMPFAAALGVRCNGLDAADALRACTVNAAKLLGLGDRGTIEPGCRADLILLRHTDERNLMYEFGGNPVEMVMIGGRRIQP